MAPVMRVGRFPVGSVGSPNSYLVLALNTFSLLAWRSGFLEEEAFPGGDYADYLSDRFCYEIYGGINNGVRKTSLMRGLGRIRAK